MAAVPGTIAIITVRGTQTQRIKHDLSRAKLTIDSEDFSRLNKMELAWIQTEKKCSDDSIAKQALQWTLQGRGRKGRLRNTWKRDLEKNMDGELHIQLLEETSGLWPVCFTGTVSNKA